MRQEEIGHGQNVADTKWEVPGNAFGQVVVLKHGRLALNFQPGRKNSIAIESSRLPVPRRL